MEKTPQKAPTKLRRHTAALYCRRVMRSLLILLVFPFLSLASSVSISSKTLTPEQANELGIHRLTSENVQSNWIVLVYPNKTVKAELSEVIVTLSEDGKLITTFPVQIRNFEISPLKRLDVVLEEKTKRNMQVSFTYGAISYVIENVMELKDIEYNEFVKQYNRVAEGI
ncbi:hypothetical protein N7931_19125 [Catenovulum sp. 2E275]|uniref:hypothetical protein n=1 Tax=Catenovulum sp. 2E275 TaxID=2980497 RepID=UPI0021D01D63|nr:hypothetical protein [Catenovulum sp. 2E275]MCU4677725.1 hypothetical protein [Catenovulum sp. 2E275]